GLLQNLDLFRVDVGLLQSKPRDVAARPCKTRDKFIRIIDRRHNDRNGCGGFLGSSGCGAPVSNDHIYLLSNKFSRKRPQFRAVLSRVCLDTNRAAFNIVEVAKSCPKCTKQRVGAGSRRQPTKQGDLRLLGPRTQRLIWEKSCGGASNQSAAGQ